MLELTNIARPRRHETVTADTIEKSELYRMVQSGLATVHYLEDLQRYINDSRAEFEKKREEDKEPFRKAVADELKGLQEHVCGGKTVFVKFKKGNKHDFPAEERHKLAESGEAMPDGSFPIRNGQDLKDAIRSIGRASDPSKVKSWIRKRAGELGMESEIPGNWKE